MKTRMMWLGCGAACVVSAPVFGQTVGLQNGGFEQSGLSNQPRGWHNLSNPLARRRTLTDGLTPPAIVRTGNACAVLRASASGGFTGFTTDTVDFSTALFFDPVIDWAAGDLVATGWYNIPADAPINDSAGMKFEIRLATNQIAASKEVLGITGHTNGEWRQFELRFTRSEMDAAFEAFEQSGFYNPSDGLPNRVSILFLRFIGDGTPSTGNIWWDDMAFVQEPGAPTCPCPADYNQSGSDIPDIDDLLAFFDDFNAGLPAADVNCTGEGSVPDIDDLILFFEVFNNGCP